MKYSAQIMEQLRLVSEMLIAGKNMPDDIGLLTGKTGIALFFLHLARGTGNNAYEDYAAELIDSISESLYQAETVTYAGGLAGICAGISYLIKQQYIDADADELLDEVDSVIRNHTPYYLNSIPEICFGKTGLGKYYTERLANKTGLRENDLNQTQLSSIIQSLSCPYNTYRELFSVIHFLPDVVPVGVESEKTDMYLNYAVDKMEAMVYEDIHFGIYPGHFNPLYAATLLYRVSAKTGNEIYSDKAQQYLYRYEPEFRVRLNSDLQVNMLKWSFLYRYLGQRFQNSELLQLSDKWLADALTKEFEGNTSSMGLLDGYAGAGMYLLSLNNLCGNEWLDIVPFYIEKITPQTNTP